MEKIKINYFVDIGMGACFLISAVTGIIKFPLLITFFRYRIPMRTISFLHDWSSVFLVVLVLVHLILHWKWLVAMTKNFLRKE